MRLPWDKHTEICRPDKFIEDKYDLSYDRGTTYTIKNHQFNSYLAVIRGKDEVRDIPFISGSDSNDPSYQLLTKWKPELRYDLVNKNLTKKQVSELYDYCSNMYNAVVENIGFEL